MEEVKFTHEEINDLARKVSALEPFFSKKERELLLAIFASAAEHIKASGHDNGVFPPTKVPDPEQGANSTTLEELQRQLLNAYFSGNEAPPRGINAKITGDTVGS